MTGRDLSQMSMHDLFRVEAENQTQALTSGLLALERDPKAAEHIEVCMRAAHSFKGAARIVDVAAGVTLAHAMEDFLVAAQAGKITLDQEQIDLLLDGVDLMMAITRTPDLIPGSDAGARRPDVDAFVEQLRDVLAGRALKKAIAPAEPLASATPAEFLSEQQPPLAPARVAPTERVVAPPPSRPTATETDSTDRALRVTVENLNRLLGLAGHALVESRWLKPFGEQLLRLKRMQRDTAKAIDSLREALSEASLNERAASAMVEAQRAVAESQQFLSTRLEELEVADRHSTRNANRLYDQALACRMRPFSDGVTGFPRMVRDVGRTLGKQVRLEIVGSATQIDRDILERLDAPLGHLLRNAVDHGIEAPDVRRAAGKPAEGVIQLEARHSAGALQIIVSDDGGGIDLAKLRETIVKRGLSNSETVEKLSDGELLEFLFLPGFSMKGEVTEISGRGVGLDAVQDMVKQVRGTVRTTLLPSGGARFQLQLPLTLSVVRTMVAEVGGEPYAFPLAHIFRALRLPRDSVIVLEGRQYFDLDGQAIGLVMAHQILGGEPSGYLPTHLSLVVIGEPGNRYGLVVEKFLGGRELVVQPLDPRLGKIKDISAASLMEDGSPLLIVDAEDMIRSMEKLAHADRLNKISNKADSISEVQRKRILVVDDSLIVRELERKLFDHHGYEVEVAVNGMDGWNAIRAGKFDLIVTDIDMPRMDGIELVTLIKKDAELMSLPVMILSYKDRDEDRRRGLDAGADYYLTKGSFHDETLINAVVDLIGEATA